MPKNQTESKRPRVEKPREEGLSSSVLLADLIEHWERRCVTLDKLVDDAKKTASEETIARLQGKASMARSMTVELKREIRSANDKSDSTLTALESLVFALLESRHETMLQWCEPWPACGPGGNDLDAHIILRSTIHDCINMQRRAAKSAGRPTMGDDKNHLLDFMAIHWTRVVEANAERIHGAGQRSENAHS